MDGNVPKNSKWKALRLSNVRWPRLRWSCHWCWWQQTKCWAMRYLQVRLISEWSTVLRSCRGKVIYRQKTEGLIYPAIHKLSDTVYVVEVSFFFAKVESICLPSTQEKFKHISHNLFLTYIVNNNLYTPIQVDSWSGGQAFYHDCTHIIYMMNGNNELISIDLETMKFMTPLHIRWVLCFTAFYVLYWWFSVDMFMCSILSASTIERSRWERHRKWRLVCFREHM